MEEKETQIQSAIARLIELGKTKGFVMEEDVLTYLEKLDISADDVERVYKALGTEKIEVKATPVESDVDIFEKIMTEVSVDDSVKIYLKDIGRVPLLTADEELEYARRMSDGDEFAKKKLSETNLRLVVSIAKRYVGRGL